MELVREKNGGKICNLLKLQWGEDPVTTSWYEDLSSQVQYKILQVNTTKNEIQDQASADKF